MSSNNLNVPDENQLDLPSVSEVHGVGGNAEPENGSDWVPEPGAVVEAFYGNDTWYEAVFERINEYGMYVATFKDLNESVELNADCIRPLGGSHSRSSSSQALNIPHVDKKPVQLDRLEQLTRKLDQHKLFKPLADADVEAFTKEERTLWKRRRITREIVETECSYVMHLDVLNELYLQPLSNPKICEALLPNGAADSKRLFANVDIIHTLNMQFLKDLENRLVSWPDDAEKQLIGDLFQQFAPYFKMYSQYVNNHEAASRYLDRLMGDSKFTNFQKFLEEVLSDPRSHSLTLHSLLITPIQRIPRYKLLLSELLRYTDESHPDAPNLHKALEVVGSVASHINDAVRLRQNRDTIRNIQDQFVINPYFIKPSREFIRQGTLVKKCRSGPKKYEFFLFNDMLAYASSVGWKFKLHRKLPIDNAFDVEDLPDQSEEDGGMKNRMLISNSTKSFVCFADDLNLKLSWMEDFQDCIEAMKMSLSSQRMQELGTTRKKAPVVAGLGENQRCRLCKSPFNLFTRRRQCRFCGIDVCHNCSKARLILQNLTDKRGLPDKTPKRVCDRCANVLQKAMGNNEPETSGQSPKLARTQTAAPRLTTAPSIPNRPVSPKLRPPPPLPSRPKSVKNLLALDGKPAPPPIPKRGSIQVVDRYQMASDEEDDSSEDEATPKRSATTRAIPEQKVSFKKPAPSNANHGVLAVNSNNFSADNLKGSILMLPKSLQDKADTSHDYLYSKFEGAKQTSGRKTRFGRVHKPRNDTLRRKKTAPSNRNEALHFMSITNVRVTGSSAADLIYSIELLTRNNVRRSIMKKYANFRDFHTSWNISHSFLNVKYKLPPLRKINDTSVATNEQRRQELEAYIQGVSTVPDLAEHLSHFIGVRLSRWRPDQQFYDAHDDWRGEARTNAFGALRNRFETGSVAERPLAANRSPPPKKLDRRLSATFDDLLDKNPGVVSPTNAKKRGISSDNLKTPSKSLRNKNKTMPPSAFRNEEADDEKKEKTGFFFKIFSRLRSSSKANDDSSVSRRDSTDSSNKKKRSKTPGPARGKPGPNIPPRPAASSVHARGRSRGDDGWSRDRAKTSRPAPSSALQARIQTLQQNAKYEKRATVLDIPNRNTTKSVVDRMKPLQQRAQQQRASSPPPKKSAPATQPPPKPAPPAQPPRPVSIPRPKSPPPRPLGKLPKPAGPPPKKTPAVLERLKQVSKQADENLYKVSEMRKQKFEPSAPQAPASAPSVVRFCAECGSKREGDGQRFCQECGFEFAKMFA